MAVQVLKTEPKCKLCVHPRRAEIDELLELRSNLTRDPVSKQLIWTASAVIQQLAEWEVVNPTEENLKVHWKKHCAKVSAESVVGATNAGLELYEKLKSGEAQHADPDENLRLINSLWRAQMEEAMARGEVPKVPHDVMLKAIAEQTRRSSSETQHELLTMFVGSIGQGIKTIAEAQPKQQGELIEAVEVAEFTVTEDAA